MYPKAPLAYIIAVSPLHVLTDWDRQSIAVGKSAPKNSRRPEVMKSASTKMIHCPKRRRGQTHIITGGGIPHSPQPGITDWEQRRSEKTELVYLLNRTKMDNNYICLGFAFAQHDWSGTLKTVRTSV